VDDGAHWAPASTGLTSDYIFALATRGSNLFAGTFNSGGFRSTDNGATWTAINYGITNANVAALGVSGGSRIRRHHR
jgi:hypothetical protein